MRIFKLLISLELYVSHIFRIKLSSESALKSRVWSSHSENWSQIRYVFIVVRIRAIRRNRSLQQIVVLSAISLSALHAISVLPLPSFLPPWSPPSRKHSTRLIRYFNSSEFITSSSFICATVHIRASSSLRFLPDVFSPVTFALFLRRLWLTPFSSFASSALTLSTERHTWKEI